MSRYRSISFIFLLIASWYVVVGQDSTRTVPFLDFRGYVKDLQGVYVTDDLSSLTSSNLIHNRLNFHLNFSAPLTARVEIRNRIYWGDQLKQIPDFGHSIDQYNGLLTLSHLWVDEKTFVVHSVIDRLMVHYATARWDIRVGRQRINWGLNTVWNPNDLFNAYNFLDFDYEERPGNDAIRVQHVFPNSATADIAVKPGENKDESVAAFLYRFNTDRYDVQLLGGVYYADCVIGGGWAGHIKEAGFKGEISYFHPKENMTDTIGTISASVMADQTFKGNWYLSASFLYNSKPSGLAAPGSAIFSNDLSAKNLFPFRYTWYAGAMNSLSPITTLSMAVIYSPTYTSLILFPSFAWNVAGNFDIGLVVQSSFAKLADKFKTQGNAVFLQSKWSF